MGVNIWVTGADGKRMPICWGVGLVPNKASDSGYVINFMSDDKALTVRETPAEVMALVAAEERKQQRREIAAMALKGVLTNLTYTASAGHADEIAGNAVAFADALLAALDAREGE